MKKPPEADDRGGPKPSPRETAVPEVDIEASEQGEGNEESDIWEDTWEFLSPLEKRGKSLPGETLKGASKRPISPEDGQLN